MEEDKGIDEPYSSGITRGSSMGDEKKDQSVTAAETQSAEEKKTDAPTAKAVYEKPVLLRHGNLRLMTQLSS